MPPKKSQSGGGTAAEAKKAEKAPAPARPEDAPVVSGEPRTAKEADADQKAHDESNTTAETAGRNVGGARGTSDLKALPHPDLPVVAGPDAKKDEVEEAVRSQGPSGRTEVTDKTKITLTDGKTVTVPGDVARIQAKLHDRAATVMFRDRDSGDVVTIAPDEVRKVDPVKS